MRKGLLPLLLVFMAIAAISCGGGDSSDVSVDAIKGKWKITKFESTDKDHDDPKMKERGMAWNDCELEDVYEFTGEKVGKTKDGVETMKLFKTNTSCEGRFTKPGDVRETKWGLRGSTLFISSVKIGGMSRAGGFDIQSFDGKTMVIEHLKATITFEKMQ